jgi:hypothetical protein
LVEAFSQNQSENQSQIQQTSELIFSQIKTLLWNLSNFAYSEPLILYPFLNDYLTIILGIISEKAFYEERVLKISLIAVF